MMRVAVVIRDVFHGLHDHISHAEANDDQHKIKDAEKDGMVGSPPRQVLRKRTVDGFTVNHDASKGYFTESLSSFPGRNLTTLLAGILISWPVRGLRPVRSLRSSTRKVPKPVRV